MTSSNTDTESDTEINTIGDGNGANEANWGKAKFDYYYTDYVDKDYPSKLTAKEEKLAAIEQEEALRIQKKLMSTLEDVDLDIAYDNDHNDDEDSGAISHSTSSRFSSSSQSAAFNLIDFLERQNKSIEEAQASKDKNSSLKRKRVTFDEAESVTDESAVSGEDDDNEGEAEEDDAIDDSNQRRRRPINMAIQKNRGLTPYKKKEYRNPRVKHKLKYKKAMSKRRRNVREAQTEFYRYSGETSGIKTSTIKSIRLC